MITGLIYNRTQADVDFALANQSNIQNLIGSLNYTDLNRIETASKELCEELRTLGYYIPANTVDATWTESKYIYVADFTKIKYNVELLKDYFIIPSSWKPIIVGQDITFEVINAIEWDLHIIDNLIDGMKSAFRHSGTFNSGMEGLRV